MNDADWMHLALAAARNGIGKTAPNPPVGAVIVKNDILLATGWHRKAGLPHAEVEALTAALQAHGPEALRGATAYITLEPCSTSGRTPACTSALTAAGISRVVYASTDPNPAHTGAATAILTATGILVESGILKAHCDEILRPFAKTQTTGLPWVTWKCAMSLDGRITRPAGEGQWLSGPASRADVQLLRSQADAILTSGETVRRDLPALTIRVPELLEGREQPWRIVMTDQPETMPLTAPLFTDPWQHRTLLRSGKDPEVVLRALVHDHGILSVLLEAGGKFSAAMLRAGLVDEAVIYYAPLLCGNTIPALSGEPFPTSLQLEEISYLPLGDDLRVHGLFKK